MTKRLRNCAKMEQTPHQQVVVKITEKHAPVTNIFDKRATCNDGRPVDARQVIDNSQTLNIDARTQQ